MIRFVSTIFCMALALTFSQAQTPSIYNDDPEQRLPVGMEKPAHRFIPATGGMVDKSRVEPPYWWIGMVQPSLEVLIYDQGIRDFEPVVSHPGVTISKTTQSTWNRLKYFGIFL